MPTNVAKYNDDELIMLLSKLQTLNKEIKELMHTNVRHQQSKVETRSAIISRGKVYRELKPMTAKLLKECEKKKDKESGEKKPRKIRITRIHPKLAKFLRLKERGLPVDKYPDTLVMSYFSDWVVREGRRDGLNVKLFGRNDEFVQLFKEELSQLGSGADKKDEEGNEIQTSVLDKDGNIVNPFPRCKHMVIFKNQYVQKRQLQGDTFVVKREPISGDEYTQCLPVYEKERDLLTKTLKDARGKYKKNFDKYHELLAKQEEAKNVGDNSARSAALLSKKDMEDSCKKYIQLLNTNSLTHKLKV